VSTSGGAEGGGLAIATGPCNDQVTIEVSVRVKTDNGAFDDTFPATLTVETASFASLHIDFEPEELDGSFRTEVLTPADSVAQQFAIDARFAPRGFAGSIAGQVTGSTPQVAWAAGAPFARWPEGHCAEIGGIPLAVTDEGLGQAAWEALVHEAPLAFRWDDGTETTLSLESSAIDDEGCYQHEGFSGLEYVAFDVRTQAQSGDGRIDGTWKLGASVELDHGAPSLATLYQLGNYAETPAAGFEDATGISGTDLTGYAAGGFELTLETDLSSEPSSVSGTFAILGIEPADCPAEPVDPEGGPATPGCSGSRGAGLETATISD
jgi:hypothetical protein